MEVNPQTVATETPKYLEKLNAGCHLSMRHVTGGIDERTGQPKPDDRAFVCLLQEKGTERVLVMQTLPAGSSKNLINATFYAMAKDLAEKRGVALDKSHEEELQERVAQLEKTIHKMAGEDSEPEPEREAPSPTIPMMTGHAQTLLSQHPEIDVNTIRGTGDGNIITKGDVQRAIDTTPV